jgi:acyl-coenzyme A synthetase/AMP-(fatty) acid ligase
MSPHRFRATVDSLEQAVADLIRECGALEPGEIVVHTELIACTRRIVGDRERIERRRWSTPGADPHLSYGVLNAEAAKIRAHDLT